MSGKYERAISIFRAAYTWVSQSRADAPGLGRVWFGQYAPHSSTHVPVYVGAGRVPRAFATGNLRALDRGALYWAHALVGNWAARFWIHCRDDVGAHIAAVEGRIAGALPALEQAAAAARATPGGAGAAARVLADASEAFAADALASWWAFFERLVALVKDGQRIDDAQVRGDELAPTKLFYPRSWLDSTAFWEEDQQEGAPRAAAGAGGGGGATAAAALFSVVGAALAGFVVGRRTSPSLGPRRRLYTVAIQSPRVDVDERTALRDSL